MKLRKRPIEIEAFQVTLNASMPPQLWLRTRWTHERGYEVYNELHDKWLGFALGDYVNVTDPRDYYPIHRDYIERCYETVREGE